MSEFSAAVLPSSSCSSTVLQGLGYRSQTPSSTNSFYSAAASIRLLLEREYNYVTEDESTESSQSDSAEDGINAEPCTILHVHDVHLHQQSLAPVNRIIGYMDATPIAKFVPPALPPYSTSKRTSNYSHDNQKSFSITNCVKCLESIEGVDTSTYFKAIKMFKDDVDWREMFMAMSPQRRLEWLATL